MNKKELNNLVRLLEKECNRRKLHFNSWDYDFYFGDGTWIIVIGKASASLKPAEKGLTLGLHRRTVDLNGSPSDLIPRIIHLVLNEGTKR